MTPLQILESLKVEGIELTCESGNLKVRSTQAKITDLQKSLIATNKSSLLTFLSGSCDERNCSSPTKTDAQDIVEPAPVPNQPSAESVAFKEYKLSNGETLRLTKEDFDRVVDLFRMLHRQSQKSGMAR